MQIKLYQKLAAIAVLSFLLLLPLSMIEAQISARSARQAEVTRNIAESAAGAQTLVGPVLAIRYRERVQRKDTDKAGEVRHEIVERTHIVPPQKLIVDGEIETEIRSRGLYAARLFHLGARIAGNIEVPPQLGLENASQLLDASATLVFGIADPRGVGDDPAATVNGKPVRFSTGTRELIPGQGVHVPLGAVDLANGQRFDFSIPLTLTGSERLAIAPTANLTSVSLRSNWPHPSFQGRFLPTSRTISAAGFDARWQVSHLARDFNRALAAGRPGAGGETLDISFVDPVNVYLKSERAVKYGVLFVVLTFAAFFLTEVLRRLPIHPMQYLLVGLALAMFFLLMVSLSEHIEFALAYLVASAACISLIGFYLSYVLRDWKRGVGFGAALTALYGALYGLLVSESNALVMGSILLFAVLAAVMVATRKIDWYKLGNGEGSQVE